MMKTIKSLIFDMDGVLWKDENPLADLKRIFEILAEHKIEYSFATNNSTKTPEEYQRKLGSFGILSNPDQIITSSTTLIKIMQEKYPNGCPVFLIGENGLHEALSKAGFSFDEKEAKAVVGGMDRQVNYEKFKKAILLLQKDVDFYFTNTDTSFPTPLGIIPGAGSILRTLEVGSGRKAITAGKPKPQMFEKAMDYMGTDSNNTLVIGDRLETDILGGLNANCPTALVLSGISTYADIEKFNIHPHLVHNNLPELIQFLEENNWEISV